MSDLNMTVSPAQLARGFGSCAPALVPIENTNTELTAQSFTTLPYAGNRRSSVIA
jgi:hypothetical protein